MVKCPNGNECMFVSKYQDPNELSVLGPYFGFHYYAMDRSIESEVKIWLLFEGSSTPLEVLSMNFDVEPSVWKYKGINLGKFINENARWKVSSNNTFCKTG